MSRAMPLRFLA